MRGETDPEYPRPLQYPHLAHLADAAKRAGDIARVYDGFVGIEERAGGPERAGAGTGSNSEGLLRFAPFEQIAPFGFRAGDLDGSAAAIIDAGAGFACELLNECGIEAEALDRKAGERSLPGEFAAWRQHAGTGPTGFSAERASIEQGDGHAGLRQSPGDGSADDSGSDDDGVRRAGHETIILAGRLRWRAGPPSRRE